MRYFQRSYWQQDHLEQHYIEGTAVIRRGDYFGQDALETGYWNQEYYGELMTVDGEPPPPDPPVATSLNVTPGSASIYVGNVLQLDATVYDQYGDEMVGATVNWASSVTGVATVNASGQVTGVATGQTVITASSGGASDTSIITVFAPSIGSGGGVRVIRRADRLIPISE